MTDTDRELRVSKIRNGTVIDHLTAGQALNVLALLGIDGSGGETVSVGMNVPSDTLATKDIVKVEDRELSQSEVDVLAVISPEATINIIRDYEVIEKQRIERPESVEGVLSCPNRNCITTGDEPIRTRFAVLEEGLRCHYCDEIVRESEITSHLTVT
ncbi:aspartate carbamoyltransferase regulatory subunit [Halobellus ruber]|uniref:Aspartate carbamoyltransferase regulatory chain n=1 Tax=Halobellus ruber TaxID=2761102 RepID=A0A7J9SJN5_9EURY|nr:aspartate carbamoyltransferase regulatory subunit [Halobellus ruber]MBB6646207.1 aspartate carbamoyltransferase regulatory subunit [Halobellus ruber]